jgi:hypothetical protein
VDIAAVSPATVYNVLKRSGLTKKGAEMAEEAKKGFEQPKAVHDQWHTDFSYARGVRGILLFHQRDGWIPPQDFVLGFVPEHGRTMGGN